MLESLAFVDDFEIIKKMEQKIKKQSEIEPNVIEKYEISSENFQENGKFPCILLRSTELTLNLSIIYKQFDIRLDYDINKTRCPKCNSTLKKVDDPKLFREYIPPSVYKYHKDFWICSNSNTKI